MHTKPMLNVTRWLMLLSAVLVACQPSTAARPPAPPRPVAQRGPLAADELNNIQVFKAASPSVVNITAIGLERDFFSMNVHQVPRGTGTGFVWDDKAKLPPIPLGTSRELQVGQKVYAIGNPFGLDQTMTTGIISALNREIESVTRRLIKGAIQTDAAINPGNSGGPLLDSAGRLIGVNTAIYSPSGASAGIGFAIPVDEVNRIVPRLIRDGRMVRPTLGVTAAPPELNRALALPKGVAIVGVQRGGPAARAGLQPFTRGDGGIVQGDVVTAINDEAVETLDDMLNALERLQPGDQATLTVSRAGKTRKQTVTLAEAEE